MKNIFLPFLLTYFILGCSKAPVQTDNLVKISATTSFSDNNFKKGANLSVKINFDSFATKDNINGSPAKSASDVKSAKLYLTTSNGTNPLLPSSVMFSSGILVYSEGTPVTSKVYTFSNVPPGTYFVATELFSDINGTINIIEPITYDSINPGDTAYGYNGKRGLSISTNSATVVSPSMAYTFSDSGTNFIVSPILSNAVGVLIDTNVTVQPGSSTFNNSIGVQ